VVEQAKAAEGVGLQMRRQRLGGHLAHPEKRDRGTGAIDDRVQSAEALGGGGDEVAHRRPIRKIKLLCLGLSPAGVQIARE
jgi:hypothetical protein